MKLKLDIDEREAAVLGDALNMHRTHLKSSVYPAALSSGWVEAQDSLERKLRQSGLIATISLDGDRR